MVVGDGGGGGGVERKRAQIGLKMDLNLIFPAETKCIFVPTFNTKVAEYLCSGGFYFFRQTSTF